MSNVEYDDPTLDQCLYAAVKIGLVEYTPEAIEAYRLGWIAAISHLAIEEAQHANVQLSD